MKCILKRIFTLKIPTRFHDDPLILGRHASPARGGVAAAKLLTRNKRMLI